MKNAIWALFQEMGGRDPADDPRFFPDFVGKKQLPPPVQAGRQAGGWRGGGVWVCVCVCVCVCDGKAFDFDYYYYYYNYP